MAFGQFRTTIAEILQCRIFAVVGASRDPEKYGYKVYRHLRNSGYTVYPVNPRADDIDGDPVYPSLDNLPERPDCVVAVVPPEVTEATARSAGRLRIPYFWMQPGAESAAAANTARANGLQVVFGGPCIMVALATRKRGAGNGSTT